MMEVCEIIWVLWLINKLQEVSPSDETLHISNKMSFVCLFSRKKKMTLTWVIPPLDPAIPNNAMTLALAGSASTFVFYSKLRFIFILIKKQIFTIDLKNKIDLNMTKKYKKISIRTW